MVEVPPSQLNIQPAADINDQSYRFPDVKLDNALKYVLTALSSSVLVIIAHSAIFWSIHDTSEEPGSHRSWRLALQRRRHQTTVKTTFTVPVIER